MALTTTKSPRQRALDRFQTTLARLTGLDPLVIATWIVAEGNGPIDNPLNMMNRGRVAHFTTPELAAAATARNLRRNQPGVLRAARTGGPKEQLDAIAMSTWDSCGYRGLDRNGRCITKNRLGTLLFGVYTRIAGGPPLPGAAGRAGAYAADPIQIGGVVGGVVAGASALGVSGLGVDSQGNAPGDALKKSVLGAIVIGSSYFLLTVLGLGLILLGSGRLAGFGGGGSSSAPAAAPSSQTEEIPF